MIKLPEPAKRPTMYFVGVTTGQSSIMKMFPIWAKELGLDKSQVNSFLHKHQDTF